jgi:aryl-alcohol dehydrogenase-like predicted oxidoreductase
VPQPNITRRALDKTGQRIASIGLGCMGMSEFYGPRDDDESIKVIHRAIELGMNHLDTADMYGIGHNEQLVGRAIGDRPTRSSSPRSSATCATPTRKASSA